jgi:hypothetical protein
MDQLKNSGVSHVVAFQAVFFTYVLGNIMLESGEWLPLMVVGMLTMFTL